MPEAGEYILTSVGFSQDEEPLLILQNDSSFVQFRPLDKTFTMQFNTTERHCVGWRDITKGELHTCPDAAIVDKKYEQCPVCQKRTGFNPAFYNTTAVSSQQEARNLEPHLLYLAYFGGDSIKVGISHAARGNSRLLEQGARSALILDTFPSAHIARQYEAKIARLEGIAETVLLRRKIAELSGAYRQSNAEAFLHTTRQRIESELKTTFSGTDVLHFDSRFFPHGTPDLAGAYDATAHQLIAGKCIGMLGSLLCCEQQETTIFLPLKKYIGYALSLNQEVTPIDLPAQQISLF